jgi:hypothetical protein
MSKQDMTATNKRTGAQVSATFDSERGAFTEGAICHPSCPTCGGVFQYVGQRRQQCAMCVLMTVPQEAGWLELAQNGGLLDFIAMIVMDKTENKKSVWH